MRELTLRLDMSVSDTLQDPSQDMSRSRSAVSLDNRSDSVAVVKKKKTCRGLSSNLDRTYLPYEYTDNSEADNIYSGRVAEVWSKSINECVSYPLHQAGNNVNERSSIVVSDKESSQPINNAAITKNSSSSDVMTLEESSITLSTTDCMQSRDPTPPPSPVPQKKRCRRLTKDVKMAMSKLEKAKRFLEQNKEDDDVIIVDNDYMKEPVPAPCKDSFVVKVKSRSGIYRHQMKMRDSFADVFNIMAKKEHVTNDQIVMFHNDRVVHEYDSPKSLELTIADIIDCHIRGSESAADDDEPDTIDDPMAITLALQSTDSRTTKCYLSIRKDEPMEKIMRQYCDVAKVCYSSVKFCFDGEVIDPTSSPESLDLETDFCIDVIPVT